MVVNLKHTTGWKTFRTEYMNIKNHYACGRFLVINQQHTKNKYTPAIIILRLLKQYNHDEWAKRANAVYHYTRKTLCKFFIWYVCNWSCLSLIYAFQLIDQFNETESNVRENGNDLIVPTNWHWITVNITSHHYSTWNQFDVVKTTSTQSDTTWSLFIIKLICAHRVCHTLTFFFLLSIIL